jgi:hypothetical protein
MSLNTQPCEVDVAESASFISVLQNLLDEGRVMLTTPAAPTVPELREAESLLARFEQRYRLEMPGEAPALSMPAAVWGAEMFFRACQCLVFREIDAAGVDELLCRPFAGRQDAAAHYSVDLTFRLLPDLFQRARAASRHDPLLERLQELADAWPLSSVGIAGIQPKHLEPILEHPCLRILYADRIIARQDLARLTDARVRASVLAAIGLHEELAPEVLSAAKASTHQDEHT